MAVSPDYERFVTEQLGRVVPVTAKRMFGGVGLYSNEHFFAIISDDRLYFKVDDTNQPDFEREGMGPFRPYDDERGMRYFEVPVDVVEDPDRLRDWATKAIDVAARAKASKKR